MANNCKHLNYDLYKHRVYFCRDCGQELVYCWPCVDAEIEDSFNPALQRTPRPCVHALPACDPLESSHVVHRSDNASNQRIHAAITP